MKADFNEDPRIKQALDIAMYADFGVPEDRTVFFSGARNMRQALNFCKRNRDEGFSTLIETKPYREMMKIPLFGAGSPFTQEEALDISALASARYALAAIGNVLVFTNKASSHSTFSTVELPALLVANDKVETVNGTDKMLWAQAIRPPFFPRTDIIPAHLLRFDTSHLRPANGHSTNDPASDSQDMPPPFSLV